MIKIYGPLGEFDYHVFKNAQDYRVTYGGALVILSGGEDSDIIAEYSPGSWTSVHVQYEEPEGYPHEVVPTPNELFHALMASLAGSKGIELIVKE